MQDRKPPKQIDLDQTEYRTEPRKGEPIFAPGGIAFLVSLVIMTIIGMWFSELFAPLGEWAAGLVRRSMN